LRAHISFLHSFIHPSQRTEGNFRPTPRVCQCGRRYACIEARGAAFTHAEVVEHKASNAALPDASAFRTSDREQEHEHRKHGYMQSDSSERSSISVFIGGGGGGGTIPSIVTTVIIFIIIIIIIILGGGRLTEHPVPTFTVKAQPGRHRLPRVRIMASVGARMRGRGDKNEPTHV